MKPPILDDLLNKRSFVVAPLLLVGLLRFVNLGFGEIQEWDEALYAVRAKSVANFGDWLDQSNHSVGGLYSASHPPLFVWLTALGYEVLGISNFSTRLWSAIFGCGLIFVAYLLGKHLASKTVGFVAAVLLGTNPLFTFYSRQGQLDLAYLFFLLTSLYFFLRYLDTIRWWWLFLAGVSFGLSLASKSVAGVLAVPIMFSLFLIRTSSNNQGRKRPWVAPIAYVVIGMAIVFPWYVYMELRHHYDLQGGFFLTHVVGSLRSVARGLGTNVKELGYFYFLNQLLVRFPLSVLGFSYVLVLVVHLLKRKHQVNFTRQDLFAALWFVIVFSVYSVLQTKVVNYTLPMLIPLSLLTARTLEKLQSNEFERKTATFLLMLTSVSLVWSFSDDARLALRDFVQSIAAFRLPSTFSFSLVELVSLLAAVLVVAVLVWRKEAVRAALLKYLVPAVLLISLASLFFQVTFVKDDDYVDGARELATLVNQAPHREILYLHTPHYTGGMNPQLAYHFDGVNCGWKKDILFLEMSRDRVDSLRDWMASTPERKRVFIIIEKNSADRPVKTAGLSSVEEVASSRYKRLLETKRYILYGGT